MKPPQQHRWLVSYADFMTLLCVFFIMLYAIQLIDEEDGAAIREELKGLFTTALPPVSLSPPGLLAPLHDGNGLLPLLADIRQVAQFIPESDDIRIEGDVDWITVSLNADLLFRPGETSIRHEAIPLIEAIAAELRTYPFPINVQGHADDTPSRSLTNWEISALRAAAVVQNLALYGVAPQRMAAMGLSHYHPLVTGDTEADKAHNRRVVIYMSQAGNALWTRPQE